ncbi:MAG TPA: hypothetical protein VHN14_21160 [Kofleriaceae bacterium]|jgi:hypothetical protein|nr:hypothetical protein [Kofleriaceae bacterium]
MTACIGEPISWPRLETFALGAPDPAIASHVLACPACRQCLEQIRGDVVVLPPLTVPARPRRAGAWWRRRWLAPVFAFTAAAIVLLVVLARPTPQRDEVARATTAMVRVKGVGEVTLELVRERGGAIDRDATSYLPGDRWKVVVSCPPSTGSPAMWPAVWPVVWPVVWIDVSVADGSTTDHPLAPVQLPCGNRVVVPGAFTITGAQINRVCASIAARPGAETGTACVTLRPE